MANFSKNYLTNCTTKSFPGIQCPQLIFLTYNMTTRKKVFSQDFVELVIWVVKIEVIND